MPKMGSLKDRLQDALEKLSYRQWIMIAAGASILVAGSYIFGAKDAKAAIDALREAEEEHDCGEEHEG